MEDVEVISEGRRHGVICEAARLADVGGFAAFQKEILGNAVAYDAGAMTLRYESKRSGVLEIDTRGGRWIDGRPANLDYATYDCPFLHSP
ncbi:MAG: hypothetical protein WDO13_16460 [Verrucomicrobiota bacterium]